jgi:UDP:flavonoid glycosyltransferase YjiC (YdhE family)
VVNHGEADELKTIVLPVGSSGDVHPLLGIALELRQRGHEIVFITNAHFEPLVRAAGLNFEALGSAEEFRRILNDPDIWHPTKGTLKFLRLAMLDLMRPTYHMIEKHNEPGKTVLLAAGICLGARLAHEKLGLPLVTVQLQPMALFSRIKPSHISVAPSWTPTWLMRLMYFVGEHAVINPIVLPRLNQYRKELGLAPLGGKIFAEYINSPQRILGLFPDWFAQAPADWPRQLRMTGFPLYDEKGLTKLDPKLSEFLDAGTPPIVFTPGSAMLQGLPFFTTAAETCKRLGRRGLLLTRFAENIPAQLPEGVKHFAYAPFSEILSRCAALVYHGGIGTMAQALAAGVPQLVMPMAHDQFDNAERIKALGVGKSIARKNFRAKAVATALLKILEDAALLERCKNVARKFESARPIESACDEIEIIDRETVR